MLTLVLIGLLGGLITGISPCILPVLPVVLLASGARRPDQPAEAAAPGRRRSARPYLVIAGLVLSFSAMTLLGSLVIAALGLPADLLRWVGLAVLVTVGLGLIVPKLEELLERPFARLPTRRFGADRGGFALGLGLGLLYVPCAGPVLAAITVAGATGRIGPDTVALTLAFAVGAALPLLGFALAGARLADRVRAFRRRARLVRAVAGGLLIVLAAALALDLPAALQRALPGYTDSLQRRIEDSAAFRPTLSGLTDGSNERLGNCPSGAAELRDCGPAPAIEPTAWLNTPGGRPVDLAGLRGRTVLVDFWTYSCINCQRSVPHVRAWHDRYAAAGLTVVGVHTPEFVFERDLGNVRAGIADLGITYPVAVDNSYRTWTNYRNRYWPAAYLIDSAGTVRYLHLGEGGYDHTENLIRELLGRDRPGAALPPPTGTGDDRLTADRTPETYLDFIRVRGRTATPGLRHNAATRYDPPGRLPDDAVAFTGTWTHGDEYATAGPAAVLDLNYRARTVHLVAAGTGRLTVDSGGATSTVAVAGTPRAHTLVVHPEPRRATLRVTATPGLRLYALTFG
ncbi:protein DipZ [Pilimelia anulata]|uniref:Protein DipZ n=1 Tax=Pilimelia anulata TaxID=53371 RepID=A0A8J3BEU1_9ACTN|nr:cytochrome c biogenesis protein DipZ [Pilimelia anulata]GGK09925.1 protein DipZ [Pilimelia anulata]